MRRTRTASSQSHRYLAVIQWLIVHLGNEAFPPQDTAGPKTRVRSIGDRAEKSNPLCRMGFQARPKIRRVWRAYVGRPFRAVRKYRWPGRAVLHPRFAPASPFNGCIPSKPIRNYWVVERAWKPILLGKTDAFSFEANQLRTVPCA